MGEVWAGVGEGHMDGWPGAALSGSPYSLTPSLRTTRCRKVGLLVDDTPLLLTCFAFPQEA